MSHFLQKPTSWTWIGFASIWTISVACAMVLWSARVDLQMVDAVVFDGAERATVAQLRHLVDVRNGSRLWEINLGQVERSVGRHPWVSEATALLDEKGVLHVSVREHKPVAILHGEHLVYLSERGVPFLQAPSDDLDYPHITGLSSSVRGLHPRLAEVAVGDALWLLTELHKEQVVDIDELSEIHFSASTGWTVHLESSVILFGHDALKRQVSRLRYLVETKGVNLSEPTFVDLAPAQVAVVRALGENDS